MKNFDKLVEDVFNGDEIDLFDPERIKREHEQHMKAVFADQDKWASRSDVFKRILDSETSNDPEERFKKTNNSKSKTRNALITMLAYRKEDGRLDIKSWEDDLLRSKFYGLN